MSWKSAIVLNQDETLVHSWEGYYEKPYKTMDGDFQLVTLGGHRGQRYREKEKAKPKSGVMALTNQRLLWLEKRGLIGKSYHNILRINLEDLQGISVGGTIRKYVSITDRVREHKFHLKGIGKNEFESFKKIIIDQNSLRKQVLESEKKKERVQLVMDFSSLKDYMKNGGLVLENTKCPECGAPIELPESANRVVCEHCGGTVYAQDLFEKVKALIG